MKALLVYFFSHSTVFTISAEKLPNLLKNKINSSFCFDSSAPQKKSDCYPFEKLLPNYLQLIQQKDSLYHCLPNFKEDSGKIYLQGCDKQLSTLKERTDPNSVDTQIHGKGFLNWSKELSSSRTLVLSAFEEGIIKIKISY